MPERIEPPDLQALLQASHADIQEYVQQLQAENARLHRQAIKLQVQHLSAQNRIAALAEELAKAQRSHHTAIEDLLSHLKPPPD